MLQDVGLKQALEEAARAVIGTSLSVPKTPVLSDQPGADAPTQLSLGPVVSQAAATTSKRQHARELLICFLAILIILECANSTVLQTPILLRHRCAT